MAGKVDISLSDFREVLLNHLKGSKAHKSEISEVESYSDEKLLEKNLKDDLKLDSLDAVDIVVQIEEKFDCWIAMPDLGISSNSTVSDFIDMLNVYKISK